MSDERARTGEGAGPSSNSSPPFSPQLFTGTSGWTDQSILSSSFYPKGTKSAEDRLPTYSSTFSIVEVNMSTYAVPRPQQVKNWVDKVPSGFRFHFKAFGLFCSKSVQYSALPWEIKQTLPEPPGGGNVTLSSLGEERTQEIWDLFHAALQPAKAAGKMGVVMFQFHLSFAPTEANKEHILWCRGKLQPDIPMAVEFRARSWFDSPERLASLASWLKQHNIVLIAADELRHETYQPDKFQTGLPPGMAREILPIAFCPTHPDIFYVRIHRREGTRERLLPESELREWALRLKSLPDRFGFKGEVHLLWGTDWQDAPVVNNKALINVMREVCPEIVHDWAKLRKDAVAGQKGTINAMFAAATGMKKRPIGVGAEEGGGAGAGGGAGGGGGPVNSAASPGGTPGPSKKAKTEASSGTGKGKGQPSSGQKPLTAFFAKKT